MDEGWIYAFNPRTQKRGKKLRKFYELLNRGSYDFDEGIRFWKPKINDVVTAEAKRWKALQYRSKQYAKISPAFDLVLKNTPFSCIRITKEYPGFAWVEFPHNNSGPYERGVSWNWWDRSSTNKNKTEKPESPLKQDVGDAWFYYEDRSREIRTRSTYFETVFSKSIQKNYGDLFYGDHYNRLKKLKLIINGREYLIGNGERDGFGVLVYPEDFTTEVVEKPNVDNRG
jgi:hypothetical protein